MLEDDIEKSHQDMDRIHQRIAGLGSCKKHALSISHKLKVKANPEVQEFIKGVSTRSKRKMKGLSKVEERKKAAKQARTVKREQDLATEKTKPCCTGDGRQEENIGRVQREQS